MAGEPALVAQTDFSAGAFQGLARHLIPRNGVFEIRNGLLDDSGSIYKRGGSQVLSTADFGSAGSVPLMLFDGYVSAGRRTVFADAAAFGVLSGAEAPISLGGGGLPGPRRGVVIGGCLVVSGKVYGGSLKSAAYSTGTISTTAASAIVTGAGTAWLANVDAGMLLAIGSERLYVVKSVDSDTQVTLTENYEGSTGGGKAYALQPLGTLPAALTSDSYAVAGDRLVIGSGNVVTFSNSRAPTGQLRWQTFTATDRWTLPDGGNILGMASLGDEALIFTTAGVYSLGNLAYDLTDAAGNQQQTLSRLNPDLILWGGNAGIASWGNQLVVPATEGVWMLAQGGGMELLSRSVPARIRGHVANGNQPGVSGVYRGHFILPVVTAANGATDLIICRLDRPIQTGEGTIFPWAWQDGAGAQTGAVTVRRAAGARPRLLMGGPSTGGSRILDNSAFFEPGVAVKNDHDGSTHEWSVTLGAFIPSRMNIEDFVSKLRVRYELVDAASDNPTLTAWYALGHPASASLWGTALWGTGVWSTADQSAEVQLATQAPESDGVVPFTWTVNKRARLIWFRFRSVGPSASLRLRTVEMKSRPSGKE
jgi:hypothetical protein